MQINLFLMSQLCDISFEKFLGSASSVRNPFFAKTPGLLHNSICWAGTWLLLKCFCSINIPIVPWKFFLFLNFEFPYLQKICQSRYISM